MSKDYPDANLFLGGVTTDPEVKRLNDAYPEMEYDDIIRHDEIETIIENDRRSNRYQAIVTRWRKLLERDKNLLLVAVIGVGFIVADPSKRIIFGSGKHASGIKAIKRAGAVVVKTEREGLSDEEKRLADHLVKNSAAIVTMEQVAKKELRGDAVAALTGK